MEEMGVISSSISVNLGRTSPEVQIPKFLRFSLMVSA
jgi:hypothetical protein